MPPLKNANIIANKWIFRIKRNPTGAIERYKARLIAKGFTQFSGVDYKETFSPVIKATTIRVIIILAMMHKWPMH